MPLIYIVEDDANIRELEQYALNNSGFETAAFGDSTGFYQKCEEQLPDLILLDIMLPNEDGLNILQSLRQNSRFAETPVIMVTAKTTELDKVKGLDLGADDYISKPFGVMELVSRVKAVLRRATPNTVSTYHAGDIFLDDEKHHVTAKGLPCELTFKEYELLKYLMMNCGIVLSREKIMDKVWGFDYEGESRTVDVHIKTLRQKLGECGKQIKTIRNVGYKIGE